MAAAIAHSFEKGHHLLSDFLELIELWFECFGLSEIGRFSRLRSGFMWVDLEIGMHKSIGHQQY